MYNCEILADSLNPQGDRLTTMKVTFPRFILAEFNTHRMFSRNSASSRAIPFKKMVQMVEENPFIPIAWQKDHKGMQGTEYFEEEKDITVLRRLWLQNASSALQLSEKLHENSVTKQLCNRLLEPFMWHTVIVTATEWENFFQLRCPQYYYEPEDKYFRSKKDFSLYWFENFGSGIDEAIDGDPTLFWLNLNKSQAEIHIQAIAELMWDAMNESSPKQLEAGQWHIPFGDNILDRDIALFLTCNFDSRSEVEEAFQKLRTEIAVARCARISYETLGDEPKIDYKADLRLYGVLKYSKHYSPFEHVARVMGDEEYFSDERGIGLSDERIGWCRNFRGFIQQRVLIDDVFE